MNAALQEEQAPEFDTLIGAYATPVEIKEVEAVFLRGDAYRSDVESVRTALSVTARNIERHNHNGAQRFRDAAARALGENVTPTVAAGRSLATLREEEQGLTMRLMEAEEAVKQHGGEFRAAVVKLVRLCAERAAADYVDAAKRLAWCHLHMGVAQTAVGRIVDEDYWKKFLVPGSEYMAALKGKSRLEDDSVGPCLVYQSADRLSLGVKDTASGLRNHLLALFGASPF